MDPFVIAAIIAGVAGLSATIVNAASTNKTNKESMDFSRESAETAQQHTKELMDYNSPSYQMGRIVDAGLNPNLAYDNLDTPVPTGAQPSQPNLRPMNVETPVSPLEAAQIRRLNAATENETDLTDAQVKNLYKGLDLKDAEIDVLFNQAKALGQSIQESQAKIRNLDEHTRGVMFDNMFKERSMEDRIAQVAAERGISETQARYQERYIAATILNLKSQAALYKSQIKLNDKQMEVLSELTNVYHNTAVSVDYQNQLDAYQVKAAGMPSGISNLPIGTASAYRGYFDDLLRSQMIQTQNHLLQKYGDDKEVLNLIESVTRSILNVSNAAGEWVPSHSKKSVGGVPVRTTSGHFPIK